MVYVWNCYIGIGINNFLLFCVELHSVNAEQKGKRMKKEIKNSIVITLLLLSLCACAKKEQIEESVTISTKAGAETEATVEETESIYITQTTEAELETAESEMVYELVTEVGEVTSIEDDTYSINIDGRDLLAVVSPDTIVEMDSGILVGDKVVISYDRIEENGVPLSNTNRVYALMKVEEPVIETEEPSVEESTEVDDTLIETSGDTSIENAIEGDLGGGDIELETGFIVYSGSITELSPNGFIIEVDGIKYFVDTIQAGVNSIDYTIGQSVTVEFTEIADGNPKVLLGISNIY